ncbi:MAG: hypothetical protein ACOH5I_20385 [Oligoflexus sp.]
MKLIEALKKRIESYWLELQQHDRFNRSVLQGDADSEMLMHFLVNVRYLVQHTPIHLKRAMKLAEQDHKQDLKNFFEQKLKEEDGHDQWADADIEKLKQSLPKTPLKGSIDPSMKRLIAHIEETIDRDPYLYLAYIFFAEYLCVICGEELTHGLQNKCGYPPRSLTVIENHAELDQDHVHEWEETIASLIDEQFYSKQFLATLEKTIAIHREFYRSCGERQYDAAS